MSNKKIWIWCANDTKWKNVIAISKKVHRKISGYYSRIPRNNFTNGLTVRNWLSGQSYQAQYEFGMKVLKMFGGI